MHVAMEMR